MIEWRKTKFVGFFVVLFIVLCLSWSAAFFIMEFIYNWIDEQPNPFVQQITNSVFGLFIFVFFVFVFSKVLNIQRQQIDFLQSLNNALFQIAGGDYKVNVKLPYTIEERGKGRHPFVEVAQNVQHMADELNELEELRQEFVSNVSHEIQSPLTSISGFAQALKDGEIDEEVRKHYLDIIEMESKRLSKLSDNLLKLTSLDSNHHPFEPESYRLDKQLRTIILSCEPQWLSKSIDMDISLEEVTVTADKDLMSQVWMNLLGNAIKFTSNGGRIGVYLSQHKNNILVRITDTGIGMDEEVQSHIFERFYKADKSRNRAVGGSGLGLSIVKKIIDMHRGEIVVKSVKGEGTKMMVTLSKLLFYQ